MPQVSSPHLTGLRVALYSCRARQLCSDAGLRMNFNSIIGPFLDGAMMMELQDGNTWSYGAITARPRSFAGRWVPCFEGRGTGCRDRGSSGQGGGRWVETWRKPTPADSATQPKVDHFMDSYRRSVVRWRRAARVGAARAKDALSGSPAALVAAGRTWPAGPPRGTGAAPIPKAAIVYPSVYPSLN